MWLLEWPKIHRGNVKVGLGTYLRNVLMTSKVFGDLGANFIGKKAFLPMHDLRLNVSVHKIVNR